jgi:hypothetical protein
MGVFLFCDVFAVYFNRDVYRLTFRAIEFKQLLLLSLTPLIIKNETQKHLR